MAESLTPGYDVSSEYVSGLGTPYFSGSCNAIPSCVTPIQPGSAVFVFSVFLLGMLSIWGGYLLRTATRHRLFALAIIINGLLQLLIGISYVPLYLGVSSAGGVVAAFDLHVSAAIPIFVLAAVLPIWSSRITRGPFRYFGLALGLVAFFAFLISLTGNYLGLGLGGMERMNLCPASLWIVGFGTYLFGGKLD